MADIHEKSIQKKFEDGNKRNDDSTRCTVTSHPPIKIKNYNFMVKFYFLGGTFFLIIIYWRIYRPFNFMDFAFWGTGRTINRKWTRILSLFSWVLSHPSTRKLWSRFCHFMQRILSIIIRTNTLIKIN